MNDQLAHERQGWLQTFPDPAREVFARRVFQAFDLVQVIVIEPFQDRVESRFDVGEVHHPTGLLADRAFDVDADAKRVAVQAGALVAGRDVGQEVGGFEVEGFADFHGAMGEV